MRQKGGGQEPTKGNKNSHEMAVPLGAVQFRSNESDVEYLG